MLLHALVLVVSNVIYSTTRAKKPSIGMEAS